MTFDVMTFDVAKYGCWELGWALSVFPFFAFGSSLSLTETILTLLMIVWPEIVDQGCCE